MPLSPNKLIKILVASAEARIFTRLFPSNNVPITFSLDFNKILAFKKQPLSKKEIKDLKKIRDSNIVWMSVRWIYKEIQPYIHAANRKAGRNFDWEYSESCQFTKYKLGQYYDWHTDAWEEPYTDKGPTKGKIRKLSKTVSLSDQKENSGVGYEGAIVLTPKPGIYFEPVAVLDYASLYPSSMIAENVSHDSMVCHKYYEIEHDFEGNPVKDDFTGEVV